MSDELDPQLSHWFANSNQPLPQADFQARFIEKLHRSRSWMGPLRALTSMVRAILLGLAAPFAVRRGHLGLLAASGAAMMMTLILL